MAKRRHRLSFLARSLSAVLLLSVTAASPQSDPVAAAGSLVRAGRYDQAIAAAERSLRTDPRNARLLTIEGIAYSMTGKDEEALRALHKALQIEPHFMAALRAEAQIEVRGHRPGAIPVLREILRLEPTDATAREMLAGEQARAGECDAALQNFALAGSSIEAHAESLLRQGSCLFHSGKNAEAAAAFTKLVALDPQSRDARYDLALAQVHAGDHRAAVATLAPLTGELADVDSLSLAAEAAEAAGDTPAAVTFARRAIVLDPLLPDSYVRFAELCMQHESYAAGIAMVSAGLTRLPSSSPLYLARGMLYGGEADYSKAEADFRSAETFDPRHGTGAYGVGLVQAQGNHSADALKTVREGLRLHPEDGQLNLLLARLQIEGGEVSGTPGFVEALHAAETAVRVRPDLVAAHDILSKAYMMEGNTSKAITECHAALNLDPEDMVAMYRLMLASRKLGDTATVHKLTQRVAEGHRKARSAETDRLRYRIEGASQTGSIPPARP